MIIRTGLIRNRDGVDFDTFTAHWREVHGPLALAVSEMRAYVQNHVRRRLVQNDAAGLHRVDGISQLWFDNVEHMKVAMDSAEQRACIEDLRGFLSDVTLLIQQAGEKRPAGSKEKPAVKLLFLLHGEASPLTELSEAVLAGMADRFGGGQVRFNPIIARDVEVDPSIPAGRQVIDGVLEVWLARESAIEEVLAFVKGGSSDRVVSAFVVDELVLLDPAT